MSLHRHLTMLIVCEKNRNLAQRHERRLHNHINNETLQFLDNHQLGRILKKIKPFEIV